MSDHPLVAIPVLEASGYSPMRWVVRPKHCLGTGGWYPYAWQMIQVTANSEREALRKAAPIAAKQRLGIKP